MSRVSEQKPSPAAVGEAIRVVDELTAKFHELASILLPGDPCRDAFFAAQLLAEEAGRKVRRVLAAPVEAPAVGQARVPGEGSPRPIARHRANGGSWT